MTTPSSHRPQNSSSKQDNQLKSSAALSKRTRESDGRPSSNSPAKRLRVDELKSGGTTKSPLSRNSGSNVATSQRSKGLPSYSDSITDDELLDDEALVPTLPDDYDWILVVVVCACPSNVDATIWILGEWYREIRRSRKKFVHYMWYHGYIQWNGKEQRLAGLRLVFDPGRISASW